MIGNQTKGRGFRGVLNYLLEKQESQLIGGNMIGVTPRELASEFGISIQLNPHVKRTVYHASLSLLPGQRLNDEQWNALAASYLERMGFTDNQYIVVRHSDRLHDHIHIVASRVRLDGSCVHDGWDYRRSEEIIRQLERDYNLTPVTPSWEVERRNKTKGQFEQNRREVAAEQSPTASVRETIQDIADRVIQECTTPEQFIEKMQDAFVMVQTRIRRDGSISGISYQYELDGVASVSTSGTKLGNNYTWNGIQRRIQELLQQRSPVATHKNSYSEEQIHRGMNPQQLWSHYSSCVEEQHRSVEEIVTSRALRDGQPPEMIRQMLEHSQHYKSVAQQYGRQKAQRLADLILNAAIYNKQQQALTISKTVLSLLNELRLGKRQADGSLLFKGNSFEYRQEQRTISLSARDGRSEILRVTDGQVIVDKMTSTDLEKCHKLQQEINKDLQKLVQQKPELKQDRGLSL